MTIPTPPPRDLDHHGIMTLSLQKRKMHFLGTNILPHSKNWEDELLVALLSPEKIYVRCFAPNPWRDDDPIGVFFLCLVTKPLLL